MSYLLVAVVCLVLGYLLPKLSKRAPGPMPEERLPPCDKPEFRRLADYGETNLYEIRFGLVDGKWPPKGAVLDWVMRTREPKKCKHEHEAHLSFTRIDKTRRVVAKDRVFDGSACLCCGTILFEDEVTR